MPTIPGRSACRPRSREQAHAAAMRRAAERRWLALLGLLLLAGLAALRPVHATQTPRPAALALSPGESLVYDVQFGLFEVGTARMEVLGQEVVRGRAAWHTRLAIDGGALGFRVRDVLESWIDVETGNSLRFRQDSAEGSRRRLREYEILPELGVYRRGDAPERPTVAAPLDQAAFLYFLRQQPLGVGQAESYDRYFMPDRNPVAVSVVRREAVTVPAGRFDALVLKPVIRSEGVFSQDGRAEIWLSNDERRWMVQMVTHLAFGTITLRLREARA